MTGNVLGLDLAKTSGLVVIGRGRRILHARTCTSENQSESSRCRLVRDVVDETIKKYGPFAVVGIEDTFLGRNVGLLKRLARLSGAVLVSLSDHDQAYLFIPPYRARKALRLPYFPKKEVHRALRARRGACRHLGHLTGDELDAYITAVAAQRISRRKDFQRVA